VDYTHPQYWPQLIQLAVTIDGLDYFQILNLAQDADVAQIRASYYGMARALHPDKFYQIQNPELRASVGKIYKRVVEAYSVLKDDARRKRYLMDITGSERQAKLRYSEQSETEVVREQRQKARVATTPQGEKLYQAAQADSQASRWDQAYRNLQTALMFEPANETLIALRDEVDQKRKGG